MERGLSAGPAAAAAHLPGRLGHSNALRLVLRTQPRSENRHGPRRIRQILIEYYSALRWGAPHVHPAGQNGNDRSSLGERILAHRRSGRRVADRNGRVARASHFQHTLCAL